MTEPSSVPSGDRLLARLLTRITSRRPDADTQLITRAYAAAAHWHQGQERRSGDAYLTHPVEVAGILADAGEDDQTLCAARHLPRAKQVLKSRQTLDVMVPLARTLDMDSVGAELESLAAATLRRGGNHPGGAPGRLLAATAGLLPPEARARWRAEWLAELQVLPTRRERVRFAAEIVLGMGRLAVTLYRPAAAVRQAFGAVLTAAVAASGLVVGGWRSAAAVAATVVAVLGAVLWILRSDDRTRRLAELIRAVRGAAPDGRAGASARPRRGDRG